MSEPKAVSTTPSGSQAIAAGPHHYSTPVALLGHALPWAIVIVFFFFAGGYLSFGTTIMIWILFAMSLDLVLGYAGIVTLGHAAYFGFGAYVAGICSIHLTGDPLIGHAIAIAATAVLGFVTGALILHTTGVTFLMLSLAIVSMMFEFANKAKDITGGDDGLQGMKVSPIFGIFEFNLFGTTAYVYVAVVLFLWFLVCLAAGAFAVRTFARWHPAEFAPHARDRHAGVVAAGGDLHHLGRHCRLGGRAVGAFHPVCRARRPEPAHVGHRHRHAHSWRYAEALRRLCRCGRILRSFRIRPPRSARISGSSSSAAC